MREIKFRAWDKTFRRMILNIQSQSPTYKVTKSTDQRCFADFFNDEFDNIIIMQYTGLEDKYGNEIYEGDIVMWRGYEVENGKQIRPERILTISDYIKNTYNLMCITEGTGEVVEVIGNIYENPELMEANK